MVRPWRSSSRTATRTIFRQPATQEIFRSPAERLDQSRERRSIESHATRDVVREQNIDGIAIKDAYDLAINTIVGSGSCRLDGLWFWLIKLQIWDLVSSGTLGRTSVPGSESGRESTASMCSSGIGRSSRIPSQQTRPELLISTSSFASLNGRDRSRPIM